MIGTVTDDNLVSDVLEARRLDDTVFRELSRGTEPVNGGLLGLFDPTSLKNGVYVLALKAVDAGGNEAFVAVEIDVTGDLKLGNFRLTYVDLQVPLSGIPITLGRSYDSLDSEESSDFGFGWRLELANSSLTAGFPVRGLEGVGIYSAFTPGTRVYVTTPGASEKHLRSTWSRQVVGCQH